MIIVSMVAGMEILPSQTVKVEGLAGNSSHATNFISTQGS